MNRTDSEFAIAIGSKGRKLAVVIVIAVAALLTYFAAKWGIANAISNRAEFIEVAQLASELSPSDPQTRYGYAAKLDGTFEPGDSARALAEFEAAVAVSPHNYLLWLAVGRAFGRNGDDQRALLALGRAVELAPHYSVPQWTLGNALLRQGETEKGIAMIVRSAISNERYLEPAASILWQAGNGDLQMFDDALSHAPKLRAELIPLLIKDRRTDDAVRNWRALSGGKIDTRERAIGTTLYQHLVEQKRFRDSRSVAQSLTTGAESENGILKITNGGFEVRERPAFDSIFEWRIADGNEPRIGVTDGQKRSGDLSFLVSFPAVGSSAFRDISQTIAVEPGTSYRIEGFYRATIETTGTIRWEIIDLKNGSRLAASEPIERSDEWTRFAIDVNVPTESDGVELRLIRECVAGACQTSGNIWFDDVSIGAITK